MSHSVPPFAIPSRMTAVRMRGINDLHVDDDIPVPVPGDGQVLVRVQAAGVNPADWEFLEGQYPKYIQNLPMTLGCDFAGSAAALGPGVGGLALGDKVFGFAPLMCDGVYAEYACMPADNVVPAPKTISAEAAATLPASGTTAWFALFKRLDLKAGERIFIQRSAGGVGVLAVQLAKWTGAKVIGTGSESNRSFLLDLGVDEFIDYKTTRFESVLRDVDAVLESVGGETLTKSYRILRRGGRLVSIMDEPDQGAAERHGITASRLVAYPPERKVIEQLARLADEGVLRTEVAAVFPLREAEKALALSRAGHARGKIVLSCN